MKRFAALLLALMIMPLLLGCGSVRVEENKEEDTLISLWIYPIEGWGEEEVIRELQAGFESKNQGFELETDWVKEDELPERLRAAAEQGELPDVILGGLYLREALEGYPALELSGLWDETDREEIYPEIGELCFLEGSCLVYPLGVEILEVSGEDEKPCMQGRILGFGIIDNDDEARLEGAQCFLRYFTRGEGSAAAIYAARCLPVRELAQGNAIGQIWDYDEELGPLKEMTLTAQWVYR